MAGLTRPVAAKTKTHVERGLHLIPAYPRLRSTPILALALAALVLFGSPVAADEPGGYPPTETRLPALGWVTPFAAMLLCIALLPLLPHARHWWESNWIKLAVSVILAMIAAGF